MVTDLARLENVAAKILSNTEKDYPYINAIFRLQEVVGCRFSDAQDFENWVEVPDSDAICFVVKKTGVTICTDKYGIPDDLRLASTDFKQKMAAQSYSKVAKVVRRYCMPFGVFGDSNLVITHLFRYVYIYRKKVLGLSNAQISNSLGIALSTLNHYLAKEFE